MSLERQVLASAAVASVTHCQNRRSTSSDAFGLSVPPCRCLLNTEHRRHISQVIFAENLSVVRST